MAQVRVQHSFDTEANWNQYNPVLREGEIAFSKEDNGAVKLVIGDQIGGVHFNDATVVWCSVNENLIRHNISCWERGRMCVSSEETDETHDIGSDYNNANTDHAGVRYKYRIPVNAGYKYTIKAWGKAGCRMFFYRLSEATPHPSHSADWEDITLSDDICVGTSLGDYKDIDSLCIDDVERTLAEKIAVLKEGYTFTVPDNADYMRLYAYMPNDDVNPDGVTSASMLDIGSKILFKLEEGSHATSYTPAPADSNIYNAYSTAYIKGTPPKNDPVAARQLVNCMESYAGKSWVYGRTQLTDNTDNKEMSFEGPALTSLFAPSNQNSSHVTTDCEKSLDCQTPVLLAVAGIPYWQSRYELTYNKWRGAHFYPWAKYPDITRGSAFVEWAYRNGWEVKPGINYSNLQAGDLVFWRTQEYAREYATFKNGFRMWDHVGMFTGRWIEGPTSEDEADGKLHPEVLESGAYGDVLYTDADGKNHKECKVIRRFLDRISEGEDVYEVATSSCPELETIFIRIPLETPFSEWNSEEHIKNTISTNVNKTYTDPDNMFYSASYIPSIHVTGNEDNGDLNIDIYGINGAIWGDGMIDQSTGEITANAIYMSTNFLPVHWHLMSNIATTDPEDWLKASDTDCPIQLRWRAFYDKSFNYLGYLSGTHGGDINPNAVYLKYIVSTKSIDGVRPDLTSYHKAGIDAFLAVQPFVRKTKATVSGGVITATDYETGRCAWQAKKKYEKSSGSFTTNKYRAYKAGYHSYVHIPIADLGVATHQSYSIGTLNGEYCISTDGGFRWTPLSSSVQNKLKALRIGDGENYIYIPNGQKIVLSTSPI